MSDPTIEGVPDLLGDAGRTNILNGLISDLQAQRFRLEAMRVANGHSDIDFCDLTDPDGSPMTYARRREQLEHAEGRLFEAYTALIPKEA